MVTQRRCVAPALTPSGAAVPVLVGATVAVSFSAIFIRVAGSDPGTIVWLRMSIAAALLAPWAWREFRRSALALQRRQRIAVAVGGLLLGGHFLLWTASLQLTSIASSVLLVSTHPLIVAPLGRRLLGDVVTRRACLGLVLAFLGTLLTTAGDVRVGIHALVGDLLALGGAVCLAGYLLLGRGVRNAIGVASYSAVVFGIVAATAVVVTAASGSLHVPGPRTAVVCVALAVVCTIGGHAAYNWALRRVPAATVSVAFLGEPPLTALLGLVLLGSAPPLTAVAGGVLILAGLALTLSASTGAAAAPVPALE